MNSLWNVHIASSSSGYTFSNYQLNLSTHSFSTFHSHFLFHIIVLPYYYCFTLLLLLHLVWWVMWWCPVQLHTMLLLPLPYDGQNYKKVWLKLHKKRSPFLPSWQSVHASHFEPPVPPDNSSPGPWNSSALVCFRPPVQLWVPWIISFPHLTSLLVLELALYTFVYLNHVNSITITLL